MVSGEANLKKAGGGSISFTLHRDPQLDCVVGRVHQVLLGSKIALGRLHRGVAEQQLNLLKLATGRPAELRTRPSGRTGRGGPGVDCALHPRRHRHGAESRGRASAQLEVTLRALWGRLVVSVIPVATEQELKAEIERLRAENESLKRPTRGQTSLKVSEKGALSVYGMGRFPVTLYREQWEKLLGMADEIRAFIQQNDQLLKKKE